MPYLTLLFWLALGVPGFAVLCHIDRAELKSGLLGVIGLSYLATLAILSPISILAYVFHWPLAVFSGACVLAILVGLVEILRHGWWRQASRVLVGALGFEILLVLADCIIGGRVVAVISSGATFSNLPRAWWSSGRSMLCMSFLCCYPQVRCW